jgi:hypothetical protein
MSSIELMMGHNHRRQKMFRFLLPSLCFDAFSLREPVHFARKRFIGITQFQAGSSSNKNAAGNTGGI